MLTQKNPLDKRPTNFIMRNLIFMMKNVLNEISQSQKLGRGDNKTRIIEKCYFEKT